MHFASRSRWQIFLISNSTLFCLSWDDLDKRLCFHEYLRDSKILRRFIRLRLFLRNNLQRFEALHCSFEELFISQLFCISSWYWTWQPNWSIQNQYQQSKRESIKPSIVESKLNSDDYVIPCQSHRLSPMARETTSHHSSAQPTMLSSLINFFDYLSVSEVWDVSESRVDGKVKSSQRSSICFLQKVPGSLPSKRWLCCTKTSGREASCVPAWLVINTQPNHGNRFSGLPMNHEMHKGLKDITFPYGSWLPIIIACGLRVVKINTHV